MPRLVNRAPSYRLHKASGRAVVTLNGDDVYLGVHNTPESRAEYARVLGEWYARGQQAPAAGEVARVSDVIAAYWSYASVYYGTPERHGRLCSIKKALALLRRTYGESPARDFGPLALQVVRERMVAEGWSRGYVNEQVGRLRRCFKWAVSKELVPPSVLHGLASVEGLREGDSNARETDPVRPVPEAWVEATVEHVSRRVEGLIRLQLATGMRPGEAVILRRSDLDMSGAVWVFAPERHKNKHRKHSRLVYLGPQAQEIIRPFLKPDLHAYLFSPADAEHDRREEEHAARKTPKGYGNVPGSNRATKPKKAPADRYTVHSYRRAIANACDVAFPPPAELSRQRVKGRKGTRWERRKEWQARLGTEKWGELRRWENDHRWHPHQLRHNAATRIRKQYGLEAARVVLGQKSAKVAEIYAEIDHAKAEAIMGEVG